MTEFVGVVVSISIIGLVVYLLSGNWRKVTVIVGGWSIYKVIYTSYDYVLWPVIQNKYGDISILYLSVGATILNYFILRWYQAKEVDWLGVNYLEEIKEKSNSWSEKIFGHKNRCIRILMYVPVKFFQAVIYLLKRNDLFAFFVFSLWKDSFVTTAFLRHGKFGDLDKRDYQIFTASTFLGCIYWGFVVKLGSIFIKFLFKI